MVVSAIEFIRICHRQNFHNLVVSMKSSNTRVMVQSTRLLVSRMMEEGMIYPLHLGVTEAGAGEDGRIKSAVGIGTLLADGIGDTIRVSLTEDPEFEIPVAKKLVSYFEHRKTEPKIQEIEDLPYDPFSYNRRKTIPIGNIGGSNPPVVIADLSHLDSIAYSDLSEWGWIYSSSKQAWSHSEQSADYLFFGNANTSAINQQARLPIISNIFNSVEVYGDTKEFANPIFCKIDQLGLTDEVVDRIKMNRNLILLLESSNTNIFADQRATFVRLMKAGVENPIIILRGYDDSDVESFQLKSAADIGALLVDGLGDGVMISTKEVSQQVICSTSFSILQAARTRTTKTEYISCPGCGRTLFNLQEAVARIKDATGHLKGLKIGVMGCIVNGPGEMADADYGYVGSGNGRVSLYKGKEVIKRNLSEDIAVEELIRIIKENGDWKERE
jgi:(E)-4-hydroxy-3-methylbut-2-enyl-diphosphate synthase